jgi:diguanylate cyclase (GGDEF)-like protein
LNLGDWAILATFTLLVAGSWIWPLVLYRATESEALDLDEGFVVLMVLLLPSAWPVLGFAAATLLGQIIRRRPLVKSVFNFGQMVTAVGLAVAASHAVDAPTSTLTPGQLAAAGLGAAVFFVVNTAAVAAILCAVGTPWRTALVDGIGLKLAVAGAGMIVAAVTALAISVYPWALALAVPLLVMLRYVIGGHFEARHDRFRLRCLLDTTLDAHRQTTPAGVKDSILDSAAVLFRCARVEIRTREPDSQELGAPVHTAGERSWLVIAERSRDEPFDAADSGLLEAFGAVSSAALTNATLQEEMVRNALHDPLTGLANRRLLVDHLEHAMRKGARDGTCHAVLFADVDRFKAVNDSLGHNAGDQLLVLIAQRLGASVRACDILARFGGDEFVVLAEDIGSADAAAVLATAIHEALAEPILLPDGHEVAVTMSIGIALAGGERSGDDVLRDADVAMYQAKSKGHCGAHQVYDDMAMGSRSAARLDLECELRTGINCGELEVYFQPFFATGNGEVTGAEALVRWNHPTRGLLLPGEFIDVAEESGLILPLGRFVLDAACHRAQVLTERLGFGMSMSVNLSARQFQQPGLVRDVAAALASNRLCPSQLVLEITETVVMDEVMPALDILHRLKDLGVMLAIDDFGTGYSSLGYLKHFPIDQVKIDRSFMAGLGFDPVDEAIARSVVDLANAIGITAVAEGVETGAQLDCLRELGCPTVQGFYLSRPLPTGSFDTLIAERTATARSGGRRFGDRPGRVHAALHLGAEIAGDIETFLPAQAPH